MMLKITRRLFYDVGANDLPGVIDAGKGSYNGTGSVYQRKAISIIKKPMQCNAVEIYSYNLAVIVDVSSLSDYRVREVKRRKN